MHRHRTRLYDYVPLLALDTIGDGLDDRVVRFEQPAVAFLRDVVRHAGADGVDGCFEIEAGDLEVREIVDVEDGLRFGDMVGQGGVCGQEVGAVVGGGGLGMVLRGEGKD